MLIENKKTQTLLIILLLFPILFATSVALGVTGLGLASLGLAFFSVSAYFLKERAILLFLAMRPAIDYFRDVAIFQIRESYLNLNSLLAVMLFIWALGIIYIYRRDVLKLPKIFYILPTLGMVMLFGSIYGLHAFISLQETVKFLDIILVFYAIFILIKLKKIKEQDFVLYAYFSAIFPCLLGLYQFFLASGFATPDITGRLYGTFAHPNVFAFFLLFIFTIHLYYSTLEKIDFWAEHPKLRIIIYFILLFLLLFTYTRAAWIGLLIFLIILGVLKYRKIFIIACLSVATLILILYPLNYFLKNNLNFDLKENSLINRMVSRNEDADSIEWRLSLLEESLPIVRQSIWFGHGYGSFPIIWENNRSIEHEWDDGAEAHNDYLRLAVEIGIPGLILYVVFLLALCLNAGKKFLQQKDSMRYACLLAIIISFVAISASDNMLHHTPVILWLWALWALWLE